jgi:hypothetical protein
MKRIALTTGAALVLLGSVGVAEAQVRYGRGYYGAYPYAYGYRRGGWGGGAVAAGVLGGLVLGGLAAAATAPAYAYPPYPYAAYPYGSYPYAPAYRPVYGYPGPVYAPGYAYGARRVYGAAPAYAVDPYAAPHEIRNGYRTIYVPGRGRVIVGY